MRLTKDQGGIVRECVCIHTGQDRIYGLRLRLMNKRIQKGADKGYRCTVCEREYGA